MNYTLETFFSVPQSPKQVWSLLIDFPSYGEWNRAIHEISGEARVGERLKVTVDKVPGEQLSFEPELIKLDENCELGWRGGSVDQGLVGDHSWVLSPNSSGGTAIVNREAFSGPLVESFIPESLRGLVKESFEQMNRSTAAELARRYPATGDTDA